MYRWMYSESAEMYYATRHVGMGGNRIDTLKECKRSILEEANKFGRGWAIGYVKVYEYSDENPMGDTVAVYNVKRKSDGTKYLSVSKKDIDVNKALYLRHLSGERGAF
jgi:hypothetical protein